MGEVFEYGVNPICGLLVLPFLLTELWLTGSGSNPFWLVTVVVGVTSATEACECPVTLGGGQ